MFQCISKAMLPSPSGNPNVIIILYLPSGVQTCALPICTFVDFLQEQFAAIPAFSAQETHSKVNTQHRGAEDTENKEKNKTNMALLMHWNTSRNVALARHHCGRTDHHKTAASFRTSSRLATLIGGYRSGRSK